MLENISNVSKYQQNSYYLTITHPEEYGLSHKKIFEIVFTYFSSCIYIAVLDEIEPELHTHILLVFSSTMNYQTIQQYFKNAHIEPVWENIEIIIEYMKKKIPEKIYEYVNNSFFEEKSMNVKSQIK